MIRVASRSLTLRCMGSTRQNAFLIWRLHRQADFTTDSFVAAINCDDPLARCELGNLFRADSSVPFSFEGRVNGMGTGALPMGQRMILPNTLPGRKGPYPATARNPVNGIGRAGETAYVVASGRSACPGRGLPARHIYRDEPCQHPPRPAQSRGVGRGRARDPHPPPLAARRHLGTLLGLVRAIRQSPASA